MKHTIKLLTLVFMLATILTLTGCPGPVNNYIEPPHEHVFGDWGEWEVVTAATCTENGSKKRTRTCSCGEVEEETSVIDIDPNNHNFGGWTDWTTTVEVAYDHDGEKEHTHTCTRCRHSETEKVTVSRFVAGGYDGEDAPNETYRYQYADGIKFHLYVTTQEKYDERYPSNNTNTVRLYSALRSNDIWDDYYLSFENENSLPNGVFYYDVEEGKLVNMIRLLGLKNPNHNSFKYGKTENAALRNDSTRPIGYSLTENNFYIVLN